MNDEISDIDRDLLETMYRNYGVQIILGKHLRQQLLVLEERGYVKNLRNTRIFILSERGDDLIGSLLDFEKLCEDK